MVLDGEVRALFSTETGRYSTDVTLRLTAKDAAGKTLWSGIALGHDSHFGRSYKAENYFEVMSDMLLRATYNLLATDGFRAALAKH